ncbi:unnamed protein product [Trichogramma brassicae]|uniref:UNC-45/Cro1/She4 central domain-containing protein n=1 Tax=Trichogramma brassicae TaxID=86971 RepID=A0A6H5IJI5_9HYME|nr:unnamed protein product [Trichogramma brassicae]
MRRRDESRTIESLAGPHIDPRCTHRHKTSHAVCQLGRFFAIALETATHQTYILLRCKNRSIPKLGDLTRLGEKVVVTSRARYAKHWCIRKTGEARDDRGRMSAEELGRFEPMELRVEQADTAILLLRSPERPVLLAAAAALSAYGARAQGNLATLFELDVVDSLTALLRHEDLFTRRFALKLLAMMSAVENVQDHLLRTDTYTRFFVETIRRGEPETESFAGGGADDVFLQEFASRILAELTSDPRGSAKLVALCDDAEFLLDKLTDPDPDIRKNCLEIICNVTRDLLGLDFVVKAKNDEWQDLHLKVLGAVRACSCNAKTAEALSRGDAIKRIYDFAEAHPRDHDLKLAAFKILTRLASDATGQKALLIRLIEAEAAPMEVRLAAIEAIAALTNYPSIARDLVDRDLFAALQRVLQPESGEVAPAPDELKIAACHALGRFPVNEEARLLLIRVHVMPALHELVLEESEALAVRDAATQLCLLLCNDPIIANMCTQEGLLVQ